MWLCRHLPCVAAYLLYMALLWIECCHPTPRPGRRKYKEETTRLNQQLKSASMGSKANDKAADRLQKEVDKLR